MSHKENIKEKDELEKLEEEKDVIYPLDNVSEEEKPNQKNVEKEVDKINIPVDNLGQ